MQEPQKDILTIVVSDTHFGIKANSLTWMREQFDVFNKQIIPFIEDNRDNYKCIDLVHCGDLFESRSSISPYIIHHVINLIRELCALCDNVIILGGNHDYYSPNESENYNINSLDLLPKIGNLIITTQTYVRLRDNLYIPWFSFENRDTLKHIIQTETDHKDIKNIFCHTDLEHLDNDTRNLLSNYNLLSGHIHKPSFSGNCYVLGSLYATTFADSNQDRYFYTIEDDDVSTIKKYVNEESIRFWRLYNEDVLNYADYHIDRMDQVELYIKKDSQDDPKYQKAIEFCNKEYNTNVIILEDALLNDVDEDIVINKDYDITHMCEDLIPSKLLTKFNKIKKKLDKADTQ